MTTLLQIFLKILISKTLLQKTTIKSIPEIMLQHLKELHKALDLNIKTKYLKKDVISSAPDRRVGNLVCKIHLLIWIFNNRFKRKFSLWKIPLGGGIFLPVVVGEIPRDT